VPNRAVVYAFAADLWLYDLATESVRRLTSDGRSQYETQPRFRGRTTVTFIENGKTNGVFDLDLRTGFVTPVVSGVGVLAFDWSPDGKTLAYLTGAPDVVLFTPADGVHKTIRKLPRCPQCGRGGTDEDEQRVEWSPDGSSLLAVDTGFDSDTHGTLFVVDRTGRDLVPERDGTQARWSADSHAVYYEPWGKSGLPDRLRALDVRTKRYASLPVAGVFRPRLSADGRSLAYDDDRGRAGVFVFDLKTHSKRRLALDAVGPLWVAADGIAVTEVRLCKADECGLAPPWFSLGKTERIALSGSKSHLAMRESIDADVLFA
jgi:Tol biopolymer transport system component